MVALADNHAMPVRSAASLSLGDHVLPVSPELLPLFPEGGLVRGRTVSCSGPAARSLALSIVMAAITGGRWLALVNLDDLPAEALMEFGIPLHRVVSVSSGSSTAEVIGAVLDGFEMVIISSGSISSALARRVAQRVRSREAVVITVGESRSSAVSPDLEFSTSDPLWSGIGWGTGRLVSRRVRVERSGRRAQRPLILDLSLPAPSGVLIPSEEVGTLGTRLRMV